MSTHTAVATSTYAPAANRYEQFPYRRCGRWGLFLPPISLGMWHNFGAPGVAGIDSEREFHENARAMCFTAFDLGITHFDLANNYGPPPGSAEERVGTILKEMPRHELVISTKAGHRMWPGPYGEWGSRKYLLTSLEQSLKRLKLDYVDIFYHHRPDPAGGTPLEESLGAVDTAVRQGKAIYGGISSYNGALTAHAAEVVKANGLSPLIIHQPYYNMFGRGIETDLLPVTASLGMGVIAFCPLAQGMLTNRYLNGIPADSRAGSKTGFLRPERVTDDLVAKARKLNELAKQRGQSLAQLALAWTLRLPAVTTALIGASRPEQIRENVGALKNLNFAPEELKQIDTILAG